VAELTENARTKLSAPNFAYLATVMDDGSPHVSPVWCDVEGDRILLNTAAGRLKVRNIRRDPRIALSVADKDNQYDKVDIRGRVVDIIDGDEAVDHINKLSMKYRGNPDYPLRPGEQRLKLIIEPTVVHDGM
jgi:PPOX class probable F420-dependent enzyme